MLIITARRIIILAAVFWFLCGTSLADTRWTPSIGVSATHDDNIQFVRSDPVDDYVYAIEPVLKLDYGQELTQFSAEGRVLIRRYQDNSELDDEIYRFNFDGNTNFSERFGLKGGYKFIKDTTLDSELEEIGRVSIREDRMSHRAKLAPNFKLTERVSVGLDGSYRSVEYDSDAFVDYVVRDISLPVRWRLVTLMDMIYISPGYTDRDSDLTHSESYSIRIGWNHETTERLNLNFAIGARYTELEQKDTKEKDTGWNGLASLILNYKFETGNLMVDFERNLQNTAAGDQVDVTRVTPRLRWNLTERFGVQLNGSYYITKTEGNQNSHTTEYLTAGSDLLYNLTENYVIFIGYEYSQEYQKDIQPDPRAERNRIWAGLRFDFPM